MDMKKQSYYMQQTQIDKLKILSEKLGISVSDIVRMAVNRLLEKDNINV